MLRIAAAFVVAAAIAAAIFWYVTETVELPPAIQRELAEPGDPAAGKNVFYAGGCESCHMSPGQSDPLKLGGGQELQTPFGTFYPPNISPDRETGIGAWTPAEFGASLLTGVTPDGEHEYPAFPYPSYRHMAVKDVRDLYAFLKTLPPVNNRAPPHKLMFPLQWRRLVGGWKLLFLGPPDGPEKIEPSDDAGFGRYVILGPGHCGECHTPRNLLGAPIASQALAGARLPDGKDRAPALTAAALKDWSEDDIVTALTLGFTPSGDSLGGPMAAVVRNFAQLPPVYAKAVAKYLKQPS